MSRIAVVDTETNLVTAVIVAEATDLPYQGTFFIDVDHTECGTGWTYNSTIGDFVNLNPPPVEEPRAPPEEEPPAE